MRAITMFGKLETDIYKNCGDCRDLCCNDDNWFSDFVEGSHSSDNFSVSDDNNDEKQGGDTVRYFDGNDSVWSCGSLMCRYHVFIVGGHGGDAHGG